MPRKTTLFGVAVFVATLLSASGAVIHTLPTEGVVIPGGLGQISLPFDVNSDGQNDFEFFNDSRELDVRTLGGNRLIATESHASTLAALTDGDTIAGLVEPLQWTASFFGPPPFNSIEGRPNLLGCANAGGLVCFGEFLGVDAFLGIEFEIDGGTHYGWIRISGSPNAVAGVIQEWAYESVPNRSILAGAIPEPSSAVLIGISVCGFAMRRRRS